MIINFNVKNYLSFKEEQSFDMIAAPIKERNNCCEENKFALNKDYSLLKSAVIYGANASGKSNLIKAFVFFHDIVNNSARYSPQQEINVTPYLLNSRSQKQPSEFEITINKNHKTFRYGFVVSRRKIHEEWLFIKEKRETPVFYRKNGTVDIPEKYQIYKDIKQKKMLRPNALLLSLAAIFNDKIAKEFFGWINNFNVISGLDDFIYNNFTISLLSNEEYSNKILSLLRLADLGFNDYKVVESEGQNIKFEIKGSDINNPAVSTGKVKNKNLISVKNVYDKNGPVNIKVEMPFEQFESEGTKKFFHILGPILDTLAHGKVLIIDELDTKLHPLLTQRIIKLFNSVKTNPKNAQLFFATHDTRLLDELLFRRDQIWFAEKDNEGASHIYPLTDFKKGHTPRNDERIGRNYIKGKYGAIPFLGDFDAFFD